MTIESAFWTRQMVSRLARTVTWACVVASTFSIIIVLVALTSARPEHTDRFAALGIITIVSFLVSVDAFGLPIRLLRVGPSICSVEDRLRRYLGIDQDSNLMPVLRLVMEYSGQLVDTIPVPRRLYDRWHDEVERLGEGAGLNGET